MSHLKAGTPVGVSAPSPTPSTSSTGGAKRKRPADRVVYSQPADAGNAVHINSKYGHINDLLQANPEKWFTFTDLMFNQNVREGHPHRNLLRQMLRDPSSATIIADLAQDRYRYKSYFDIRNGTQLKAHFQSQQHAKGLKISQLRDGWKSVVEDIKPLEDKREIIVKRSKDGQARMVYANDPTLYHSMDEEFRTEWHKIAIPPNPDDLRQILEGAGLKASTGPKKIIDSGGKKQKKRAARRGGKQTNAHMKDYLQDFSGIRK